MRVEAIIPAAGIGKRLKSKQPKPLITLAGKPLIVHTLLAFEKSYLVDCVILVVEKKRIDEYGRIVKAFGLKKIKKIVAGGATRKESVRNGLNVVEHTTKFVLVHDGARPFISPQLIDEAIRDCQKRNGVVVGVPVKSTIKRINPKTNRIMETLDRSCLWEIQTPQVFKKDVLEKAHRLIKKDATDDAMLVELMGKDVHVVLGDYSNIKITTVEDLTMAKHILSSKRT